MKKNFWLCVICILTALPLFLCSCKTVIFSASEPDAKIWVDGQLRGTGSTDEVKTSKRYATHVKIQKTGFFDENLEYYYTGAPRFHPKTKYITLTIDDSYDASTQNERANKDFEQQINSKYSETDAWKIISQIVRNYFEDIEVSDMAGGFMKTAWQYKSFKERVIRSKVVVKQSSNNPLKYKIKIVSEYAENATNINLKNDELFKQWDRILKTYEPILEEFQTRLSEK